MRNVATDAVARVGFRTLGVARELLVGSSSRAASPVVHSSPISPLHRVSTGTGSRRLTSRPDQEDLLAVCRTWHTQLPLWSQQP